MASATLTSITPKKSDLYSDLSRKEVTIVKPHKHWTEKGISEVAHEKKIVKIKK